MFDKKTRDLEYEINELKMKVLELKAGNEALSHRCDEYIDVLKEQNQFSCESLFDFTNSAINVFSIERSKDGYGRWNTSIGYIINTDKESEENGVHEWAMWTTIAQHKKLVEDYKKSKGIEV